MASLDHLPGLFAGHDITVELSREDGIGYVTLSDSAYALLTLGRVIRLAEMLQSVMQVPVQFHQLEGQCVTFFVFDNDRNRRKMDEYGTPIPEWLAALKQ